MKKKIRILIVEDEYVIDEEILCRLNEMDIEITKTVFHSRIAIQYLTESEIDIVLIDANIKDDLDGYQLARIVKKEFYKPFIYLIPSGIQDNIEKLNESNPSGIILQNSSLKQIYFSIALAICNDQESSENMISNADENTSLNLLSNCLFLKKNNHFDRVSFDEIFWLRAENNYTVIHTLKGDYLYSMVLKKFVEKLPQKQFLRVHRSYIINLHKIEGFEGKMVIIDNQHIPVAKNCYKYVFDLLPTV